MGRERFEIAFEEDLGMAGRMVYNKAVSFGDCKKSGVLKGDIF